MSEELATVLGWVIPAVVVFGVTAIAVATLIWGLRRAARGPKALVTLTRCSAGVRPRRWC